MRIDIRGVTLAIQDKLADSGLLESKRKLITVGVGSIALVALVVILAVQVLSGRPDLDHAVEQPAGTDVAIDLRSMVASNPRWANVRILPSEVEGEPHLMVMGTVPTDPDLRDLQSRIEADAGGMKVQWQVAVMPDEG